MIDIAATARNYEQFRASAGGKDEIFFTPRWMANTLPFVRIKKRQKKLLRDGKVMAAALVQANNNLFTESHWDLPGLAIYSDDPYFTENNCERLQQLARYIFSCKMTKTFKEMPKEQRGVWNVLTYETIYPFRMKLPDSLTEGHEAYMTTLQFSRKLLPGRRITESLFPVIVLEKGKLDAIMLPGKYWQLIEN